VEGAIGSLTNISKAKCRICPIFFGAIGGDAIFGFGYSSDSRIGTLRTVTFCDPRTVTVFDIYFVTVRESLLY